MFDHVTIRVADPAASARFYDTVFAPLGYATTSREGWLVEWEDFGFSPAEPAKPPTRGMHLGFAAASRAEVDAFHRAGIEAGHRDDGAPGERPEYRPGYYGAFLLDPQGNSVEAVHHEGVLAADEHVDHVWLRVADLAASAGFYDTIAPHAGLTRAQEAAGRIGYRGPRGGWLFLAEADAGGGRARTEHVHLAFPAADDATVQAFHRTATAAGYADNGGPGERPEYHPGYYGAFVCDPDGHNVEAVCHHRP